MHTLFSSFTAFPCKFQSLNVLADSRLLQMVDIHVLSWTVETSYRNYTLHNYIHCTLLASTGEALKLLGSGCFVKEKQFASRPYLSRPTLLCYEGQEINLTLLSALLTAFKDLTTVLREQFSEFKDSQHSVKSLLVCSYCKLISFHTKDNCVKHKLKQITSSSRIWLYK